MDYIDKISKSIDYINRKLNYKPEIGIILGSGLGGLADLIKDPVIIPYEEIPNFPVSTVEGHVGRLVIGRLGNKKKSLQCKEDFISTRDILFQKLHFP